MASSSQNNAPLGFGIIGCGLVAPFHAKAIQEIEDARLAAVCDLNQERAKKLADEFSAEVSTDYHKLLAHPKIQVICICTPNGLHEKFILAVAKAGKHIVVEKPLEISAPLRPNPPD